MENRKKVRGLKRKIRKFIRELDEITKDFPEGFADNVELHLPSKGSDWINSPNTPFNVQRDCVQALISRTKHLIDRKPKTRQDLRVILMIDFHYWYSTKIEFFSVKDNYVGFTPYTEDEFTRSIALEEDHNLAEKWNLFIPEGLEIKRIKEEIKDSKIVDDDIFGGEIWFIGEMR
ncbi:DUF3916 domain-containing protein [Paenisporosarcina sp. TG20]|uniref:DUF3916 domain-containing protein n=1 Tax=Paenisporosarcina sp. TG20 TaxID=1211706 RepID=UPI0003133674|nr:DUF3916 domain-containing protein [Paenisporosarcina sp. TG20]